MSRFYRMFTVMAVAAAAVFVIVMPAPAAEFDFGGPAFAPISGPASIPIGHAAFCRKHADECRANAHVVAATTLTQERWDQLVNVNNTLNAAIVPASDEETYRVAEYWTYPDGFGDCEDFVLAKRKALIEDGWEASTLLIAVVREASGDGHAVLMVRTDRGDLVLDNQDGAIRVWTETPYQYVKRQSQQDAGKWVDVLDGRTVVAAAD